MAIVANFAAMQQGEISSGQMSVQELWAFPRTSQDIGVWRLIVGRRILT
jgi:hypothetical protein